MKWNAYIFTNACYQCKWEKEAYYQSLLLWSTHLCTVTGNKHLFVSRKQDILSSAYNKKQTCLAPYSSINRLQFPAMCTHSTGHPKAPLWTRRLYSFSCSFILVNVVKLAKLCWPTVNGQLLRGKLEHVCAIEQVPVSGSAVSTVRACSGGSSSLIGPLKKWVEERCPCPGRRVGPDDPWKVSSNPTHSIQFHEPHTGKQRWHQRQ